MEQEKSNNEQACKLVEVEYPHHGHTTNFWNETWLQPQLDLIFDSNFSVNIYTGKPSINDTVQVIAIL